MLADSRKRHILHRRICAKALQPLHARVTPKPRELPFGVVAVSLLRFANGFRQGLTPFQDGQSLGVPKRGKGACVTAKRRGQCGGLRQEARFKHGCRSTVDPFVEPFAWGLEADLEDAEALQRLPTARPLLGLRLFAHLVKNNRGIRVGVGLGRPAG